MGYSEAKKRKRKDRDNIDGISGIFKAAAVGACVSLAAAVVLWFAVTALAYSQSDPDAIMPILAFCATYAASFAGGVVAAKADRERGLVSSALGGVAFALVLLFVSVFARKAYSSGYDLLSATLLRASVVAVSCVGGAVGRYKKQKRRYSKR